MGQADALRQTLEDIRQQIEQFQGERLAEGVQEAQKMAEGEPGIASEGR